MEKKQRRTSRKRYAAPTLKKGECLKKITAYPSISGYN